MRCRSGLMALSVMGDAPVLMKVANPSSQDRTPCGAIVLVVPAAAMRYRASGLVLWHKSGTLTVCPECPLIGEIVRLMISAGWQTPSAVAAQRLRLDPSIADVLHGSLGTMFTDGGSGLDSKRNRLMYPLTVVKQALNYVRLAKMRPTGLIGRLS